MDRRNPLLDLLNEYVEKTEEDVDGNCLYRNFLNLQGGNLYTIFSDMHVDDPNTLHGSKEVNESLKRYTAYLKNSNEVSYEYSLDLIEKALNIKVFLIDQSY